MMERREGQRIERVLPEDSEIEVGNPQQVLEKAIPFFGEECINLLTKGVESGSIRTAEMDITDLTTHKTRRIRIDNPNGKPIHTKITMSGWEEGERTIPGLPLKIPERSQIVTLFRRSNPQSEPLIRLGKTVMPDDPLMVMMRGKRNPVFARLPKDQFPKGGKVTGVFVNDDSNGTVVKGGFIFAYVNPIK